MKNVSIWFIIPQTNLHAGNESTVNFSVIDKAIQRDVTTNLPCINSSSLKGAIKEYMSECVKMDALVLKDIFGSVKSDLKDIKKGSVYSLMRLCCSFPSNVAKEKRMNWFTVIRCWRSFRRR